jgi:Tfp pilus assembly protein PilV
MRKAFTLIEVMAALLTLTIGVLSVVALLLYGVRAASRAQGHATGMLTAYTVMVDPLPDGALDWNDDGPAATFQVGAQRRSRGFLNGYFVTRNQQVEAVLAERMARVAVTVDVYEAQGGTTISNLTSRLVVVMP